MTNHTLAVTSTQVWVTLTSRPSSIRSKQGLTAANVPSLAVCADIHYAETVNSVDIARVLVLPALSSVVNAVALSRGMSPGVT